MAAEDRMAAEEEGMDVAVAMGEDLMVAVVPSKVTYNHTIPLYIMCQQKARSSLQLMHDAGSAGVKEAVGC